MQEPLLYLSGYLKRNQPDYYRRLSAVRTDGDWEGWIRFFLEGVVEAAREADQSVIDIQKLINRDRQRLLASDTSAKATLLLFERLPSMPRFTVEAACKAIQVSYPTANAAIKTLISLGIVVETSGKRKNRSFGYQAYIELLSR